MSIEYISEAPIIPPKPAWTYEFQVRDDGPWSKLSDRWHDWNEFLSDVQAHMRAFSHHNIRIVRLA